MMRGRPRARVAIGPVGLVGTTLASTWHGHTIEYLRVWGLHGAASSTVASIHAYMGPVGAVVALAGLLGVLSTARLARRLERRLGQLRHRGRGQPGGEPAPVTAAGFPSWSFDLVPLLLTVWVGECGLYLLQENLEASVAGRPLPGLAALSGVHGLAPVVHLIVAAAVVTVLWFARRQVTRLADAVRRAEERRNRYVSTATVRLRPAVRGWTPLDRWGTQRWSRPPPAIVIG
jgi:hypothetical protein